MHSSINIVREPVDIRALNATVLHQLEIDPNRPTCRIPGLDQRRSGITGAKGCTGCSVNETTTTDMRRKVSRTLTLPLMIAVAVAGAVVGRAGPIDFNRQVRPILSENCFKCHGP